MPAHKVHHRKNRGASRYQQRAAEVNRQQNEQRSQKQKHLTSLPEKNYHNKTRIPISGIALVAISLVIGIGIFVVWGPKDNTNPGFATDITPDSTNPDIIKIAVSEISTTVKFYTYTSSGVVIRFFTVKGSDNQIHVATDACDVCYSQKKGYVQQGTSMKCNNCGRTFAINSIGTENTQGGCWPSYFDINVANDYVEISKSTLGAKQFMFV